MIFYLVYISKAVKLMDKDDLERLLRESRSWNIAHHITGMLLYIKSNLLNYKGGRFIQVLEGDEIEVRTIFKKIQTDNRHHNLVPLNEGTSETRAFENWSMGFKAMDMTEYENMPGFFELDKSFLEIKGPKKSNVPINFLRSFYAMNLNDTF